MKSIFWSSRAQKDLGEILKFNTKLFSLEKAKIIVNEIQKYSEILENPKFDFTNTGEIDDAFSHLKKEYRKLIIHHCKLTYRVGKSKIYIVRVFDTRQHPNKNK